MRIKDNRQSDLLTSAHAAIGQVYTKLGVTEFVPYLRINSTSSAKFVNLQTGCLVDLLTGTQLVWLPDATILATSD